MIDLHMHTTNSDGSNTVEEIIKMCEEHKLEYISITDHNTCKAYYDEAFTNNNIFRGKIIKGCELNAEFQGRSIEILGYNINPDVIMEWREKYYSVEQKNKNNEIVRERLLIALENSGLKYNEKDIRPTKSENEFVERPIWEEIVKHPENKAIMGEDCFQFARIWFRKEVTNPNSDFFSNRVAMFPTAKEVVEIILKAGGIAFLAHPFEYEIEDTIKFIDDLLKVAPLDGIECFHPSSEDDGKSDVLKEYANKNNLHISGGSDYHGKPKPDIKIAVGKGALNISKDILKTWI